MEIGDFEDFGVVLKLEFEVKKWQIHCKVFHNPFFPFQPLFKLTKMSLKFMFTPALRTKKAKTDTLFKVKTFVQVGVFTLQYQIIQFNYPYLRTTLGTRQQKGQKKISYLRAENLKNHTLFRGTYLYSLLTISGSTLPSRSGGETVSCRYGWQGLSWIET